MLFFVQFTALDNVPFKINAHFDTQVKDMRGVSRLEYERLRCVCCINNNCLRLNTYTCVCVQLHLTDLKCRSLIDIENEVNANNY